MATPTRKKTEGSTARKSEEMLDEDEQGETHGRKGSSPLIESPMAYLGLRRRQDEGDCPSPVKKEPGIALNRRGLPARKRKKNSLIYGSDDLVSIPIRSPKKKSTKSEQHKRKTDSSPSPSPPTSRSGTPLKKTKEAGGLSKGSSKKRLFHQKKESRVKKESVDDDDSHPNDAFSDSDHLLLDEDDQAKPRRRLTSNYERSIRKSLFSAYPTARKSPKKLTGPAALLAAAAADAPKDELELTSPEKKVAASLGVSLRNLLKLPKAHKWVYFEFFYSNLDKVLFEGENDFMVCLKESFPNLKTRRLTRVEWSKIRRLMGKPRRCSPAFLSEERAELAKKRQKIRMLQQRKQGDMSSFKDLPENIPLQLTIGARVTARLRKPQDGLFMGTVDAYDTSNNTYRVRFERGALATYSIPDEEVLSVEEPEMMPLSSFTAKARPRPHPQSVTPFISPLKFCSTYSPQLASDPLLSGSTPRGKVLRTDGQIGIYPVKFLDQIVRLSKCLKRKRERISSLSDLNSEGERKKSFGEIITEDFQRRYASNVMDLANINRDVNEHLKCIQEFTRQIAPEIGPTISLPSMIREGCQEDAYDIVNKHNLAEEKEYVESPKILALISAFTSLMLQIKQLAEGDRNASELQALQDALSELKQTLASENVAKFENSVEVHIQHIQSGLTCMGNLHAFMLHADEQQQSHQHQSSQE